MDLEIVHFRSMHWTGEVVIESITVISAADATVYMPDPPLARVDERIRQSHLFVGCSGR